MSSTSARTWSAGRALTVKGAKGQKVVVRHAEMLKPDGTIYTTNLRAAKATDTYYLDGGAKRAYEPYFTFHGFQYVEVTGLDYKPEPADVTGIVVYSDLPRTGSFECSEPLVNKLVENTVWGQKGNLLDVPTDCPQRDERAGWTGDAQVFMKTACLNLDAPGFFTKWLTDLCQDSQRAGRRLRRRRAARQHRQLWQHRLGRFRRRLQLADVQAVRRHARRPAALPGPGALHGLPGEDQQGLHPRHRRLRRLAAPGRPAAFRRHRHRLLLLLDPLMAELAEASASRDDVAEIPPSWPRTSRRPSSRTSSKTTAASWTTRTKPARPSTPWPSAWTWCPRTGARRSPSSSSKQIKKQNWHLATGFLGTPFVLFALEKAGQTDLAYRLVLNETYPSWLLQVKLGSTTMWERWDGWTPEKGFQDPGMNSFNHYWLGCVGEWLQCSVAGIDTDGPGFARITIRPVLASRGKGLTSARGSYDSIRGRIVSEWSTRRRRLPPEGHHPGQHVATVYVPAKDAASVKEGATPASEAKGVKFLRAEDGYAVYSVGSGDYRFTTR